VIIDTFISIYVEYFNRLQMPFGELIEKIPILHINKG